MGTKPIQIYKFSKIFILTLILLPIYRGVIQKIPSLTPLIQDTADISYWHLHNQQNNLHFPTIEMTRFLLWIGSHKRMKMQQSKRAYLATIYFKLCSHTVFSHKIATVLNIFNLKMFVDCPASFTSIMAGVKWPLVLL